MATAKIPINGIFAEMIRSDYLKGFITKLKSKLQYVIVLIQTDLLDLGFTGAGARIMYEPGYLNKEYPHSLTQTLNCA